MNLNPNRINLEYVNNKINEAIKQLSLLPVKENNVIVFDIDDTMIYSHNNSIIPPVFYFYNLIRQLNILPVLITARPAYPENIKWTQDQLNEVGYLGYVKIFFKPLDKQDIANFKLKARESLKNEGYNVLMSVGDMWWDVGEFGGIPILIT